jgi:mannitol/fructose-specific phosphotransferase system IIA component (Ntr-type)
MSLLDDLLQPGLVTFVEGDRDEVLTSLCRLATRNVAQQRALEPGLMAREEIASTALECGVAVPHCHVRQLDDFVLAAAVSHPGIDWAGQTVHLVILVGAPEGRQLDYLRLLSDITAHCERAGFCEELLGCGDVDDVVRLLSSSAAR